MPKILMGPGPFATTSTAGQMSALDKSKLDATAGISSKTYTDIFSGAFTVTTAADNGWKSPHARASVASRIPKYNDYRVTVNGTEYVTPCRLWFERENYSFKVYEYLGNLSLYTSVSYETSNIDFNTDLPFVIISDLNGESSIDVLTSTAGSYTIKVEKIQYTYTKIPNILKYDYTWAPFTMVNNNGTYNGFSIGVNSLHDSRGTIAIGYANEIDMTARGIEGFGLEDLDVLFLENVGNLVCPAEFDVGAHLKVMLLSVPEGDDKPLKYPLMYERCDLLAVSKTDVLPHFDLTEACAQMSTVFRNHSPRKTLKFLSGRERTVFFSSLKLNPLVF